MDEDSLMSSVSQFEGGDMRTMLMQAYTYHETKVTTLQETLKERKTRYILLDREKQKIQEQYDDLHQKHFALNCRMEEKLKEVETSNVRLSQEKQKIQNFYDSLKKEFSALNIKMLEMEAKLSQPCSSCEELKLELEVSKKKSSVSERQNAKRKAKVKANKQSLNETIFIQENAVDLSHEFGKPLNTSTQKVKPSSHDSIDNKASRTMQLKGSGKSVQYTEKPISTSKYSPVKPSPTPKNLVCETLDITQYPLETQKINCIPETIPFGDDLEDPTELTRAESPVFCPSVETPSASPFLNGSPSPSVLRHVNQVSQQPLRPEEYDLDLTVEEINVTSRKRLSTEPDLQTLDGMNGTMNSIFDVLEETSNTCVDTTKRKRTGSPSPETSRVRVKKTKDEKDERLITKASSPSYAHVAVVRKQNERRQLKAYTCSECRAYYEACGLNEKDIEERMKSCKHRAKYIPPSTPQGFWTLDSLNDSM